MPYSTEFTFKRQDHSEDIVQFFRQLRKNNAMVDVTIACHDKKLVAHKLVLSTSSEYFDTIIEENPSVHPVIILTDITYDDMSSLLELIYNGVVRIPEDRVSQFDNVVKRFKVKAEAYVKVQPATTGLVR